MRAQEKSKDIPSAIGQFALIHRITVALAAAVTPDDLTRTIAVALTSPLGLRFSRVLLLRYDLRRECLSAECAMGISSAQQARRLSEVARAERDYVDHVCETLADRKDGEVSELMDQLKAGALLVEALQRAGESGMEPEGWSDLHIVTPCLATDNVFDRLRREPAVVCFESQADLDRLPHPLNVILQCPFVVLSIHCAKGLRLVVLADKAHQAQTAIGRDDLSLLNWFVSQAGIAWSGIEAYTELEEALARLRELDALKNGFLSTVSHELRTPLTAILGFVNLVLAGRAGPLTDEQNHLLTRSHRQADHLLGLVNDLLELAELQAESEKRFPLEKVDPSAALRTAVEWIAAGPRGERAHIVVRNEDEAPPPIRANAGALGRILYHLLDNAVKFSPGDDEVEVDFQPIGEMCHISIADRGIGIERARLGQIFSHFYQVDASLSRSYPGMGIGLAVAKVLLEATGGHIAVESRAGEGSVFTVVYPLWKAGES